MSRQKILTIEEMKYIETGGKQRIEQKVMAEHLGVCQTVVGDYLRSIGIHYNRKWTEKETNYLKKLWQTNLPYKVICKLLNRNENDLSTKIGLLGLEGREFYKHKCATY